MISLSERAWRSREREVADDTDSPVEPVFDDDYDEKPEVTEGKREQGSAKIRGFLHGINTGNVNSR